MEMINFPEVRSHKGPHKYLLERVITLRPALAGNRDYVAKETTEFLRFCLTSHIHTADKALVPRAR